MPFEDFILVLLGQTLFPHRTVGSIVPSLDTGEHDIAQPAQARVGRWPGQSRAIAFFVGQSQAWGCLGVKNGRVKILVDGDAAPRAVKQILFRRAQREGLEVILVANTELPHPESDFIRSVVVEDGLDVADDWIADSVEPGDLVVTADIPLAARVVERGATALDPRGTVYSTENIGSILATRNLMTELRNSSVVEGGGPPPFSDKDRSRFASAFNSWVQQSKHP